VLRQGCHFGPAKRLSPFALLFRTLWGASRIGENQLWRRLISAIP